MGIKKNKYFAIFENIYCLIFIDRLNSNCWVLGVRVNPYVKSGLIGAGVAGVAGLAVNAAIKAEPSIVKNDLYQSILSEDEKKEIDQMIKEKRSKNIKRICGMGLVGGLGAVAERFVEKLIERGVKKYKRKL